METQTTTQALNLTLSRKQQIALQLLTNPLLVELLFGGGAGGGKSMITGLWEVMECHKYPGIAIGLGRKELVRLEQTSLQTILAEVHPLLGIREMDFSYNGRLHTLTYKNGSQIILVDMARIPTDPNYERFGSLNLTHSVVEEAGELEAKAVAALSSRRNRRLNREYQIVGKTIITCNPSQNFLRTDWYDIYEKLGGGDYQQWQHGQVELPSGEIVDAYRAFVRSLPTDNPFLSKNYLLMLQSLPMEERKRLMEGDWDYETSDKGLINVRQLDHAITPPPQEAEGEMFAALDVAREGKDKTTIALNKGRRLVKLKELKVKIEPNSPILIEIAKEFIAFCVANNVGYEHAIIDIVGLGSGVLDACREREFYARGFKGGAKSDKLYEDKTPMYKNLRSESYWNWTQGLIDGKATINNDIDHLDTLRQDVLVHNRTITDKMVVVESKEELKKRLGRSPDFSDAASMADWLASGGGGNFDFFFDDEPETDKPIDEFYSPEIERMDAEDDDDDIFV